MKILFISLKIIILSCTFSYSACAEEKNNQEIEHFKQWLQNLNSVAIDFNQIDSTGKKAEGKLLVSKPHKFRCNYYAPFPILIVGNKNYISFYDYEMNQLSRIKAAENMFNFLLIESNDLIEHFKIELIETNRDEFKIKLLHLETNKESEITFNQHDKQLKKLEILEDDNIIIINFVKVEKIAKFADELFIVKNADTYGPPPRLNELELEKKYTKAN